MDISGKKTIEEINSEFKGNFVDVTAEKKAKLAQDNIASNAVAEKETLIQDKLEEQAIVDLKSEGKLDESGNVVK